VISFKVLLSLGALSTLLLIEGVKASPATPVTSNSTNISESQESQPKPRIPFPSHTTQPATTLAPGKIQFTSIPGENEQEQGFLMSALTVGIFERFEFGIVPAFFLAPESYGITTKLNIYRNPWVRLGVAFSHVQFKTYEEAMALSGSLQNGGTFTFEKQDVYYSSYSPALLSNFRLSKVLRLGFTVSNRFVDKHYAKTQTTFTGWSPVPQINLDLAIRLGLNYYLTPGISHSTPLVFHSDTPWNHRWGTGMSFTKFWPDGFIEKLALGFHTIFGPNQKPDTSPVVSISI
jgi:hypothetical protein